MLTGTNIRCIVMLWICITATAANACPYGAGGKFPRCHIAVPDPGEIVIVLQSESADRKPLPTNIQLGEPKKRTHLIDVKILTGPAPIYVLTDVKSYHREGAIFRFSGAVHRISKVVAFGELRNGSTPIGIIGIDRTKIHFARIVGDEKEFASYCMAPPEACRPWQYFKYWDMEWDEHWYKFWKLSKTSEQIAAFEAGDNRIVPYAHIVADISGKVTLPPEQPGQRYATRDPNDTESAIDLDPSTIISPVAAQ